MAAILRAGIRILAEEVDEALLAHPDVAAAVTFPVPDANFGQEVVAAVVLRGPASICSSALRRFAATHLPSEKLPRRIVFLEHLPEASREEMAAALGLREVPAASVFSIYPFGDGVPVFIIGAPRWFPNPGCPVFGIREPELDRLSHPHTIEHIAAECLRALRRFRPEGPYAIGGWRDSSVVAVEIARQLEQEGESVVLVPLPRSMNAPPRPAVAEGLRHYRRRPWSGPVLHLTELHRFGTAA
jgi:AMP-binding enzyme C-terminal domain/Thioesterase domain